MPMGPTSHVLEDNAVICIEETLHYGMTGRMFGEDVVNLDFFPELLLLEFSGFWDLDHDARMDLIDE
jgi:hypothetical protein